MWNPKKDKEIQQSISAYLSTHGITLDADAEYVPGVDYVEIRIGNIPVLWIGLPPLSDYSVNETEYTDKYLRSKKQTA